MGSPIAVKIFFLKTIVETPDTWTSMEALRSLVHTGRTCTRWSLLDLCFQIGYGYLDRYKHTKWEWKIVAHSQKLPKANHLRNIYQFSKKLYFSFLEPYPPAWCCSSASAEEWTSLCPRCGRPPSLQLSKSNLINSGAKKWCGWNTKEGKVNGFRCYWPVAQRSCQCNLKSIV